MGIKLYFFADPQKENGIALCNCETRNSIGLLIRNYKPKLMMLKKISTLKSLKNKIQNTKNKFTKKSIKKKNEVWRRF